MRKERRQGFKGAVPLKRAMGGASVMHAPSVMNAQIKPNSMNEPKPRDISLTLSKEAYKRNPRESIEGYNLDRELSNKRTRTYHNPESNQTVISHRGTKLTNAKDLKNDFLIATGMLNKHTSSRVRNAARIAKGAEEKYGSNISNVGHSLGGTMAQKTGRKLGVDNSKVVAYNPGSSPLDIPGNIRNTIASKVNPNSKESQKMRNVTVHTTGLDPISMSAALHPGKTVLKKPTGINTHGLGNWG